MTAETPACFSSCWRKIVSLRSGCHLVSNAIYRSCCGIASGRLHANATRVEQILPSLALSHWLRRGPSLDCRRRTPAAPGALLTQKRKMGPPTLEREAVFGQWAIGASTKYVDGFCHS